MSDPVSPQPTENAPAVVPPELGKLKKRLFWAVGILIALYYNIYLFPMVFHTLIPFIALAAIGFVLGFALPRHTNAASWWGFGLVLVASIVRRVMTIDTPLASEIFGGALAGGGYPPWAAWLAELIRLRIYLAALRLGARMGGALRTMPSEEAAPKAPDANGPE